MTREEAVNILKQVISWRHDNLRGHPEMKYVAEAIEFIMSSLPSLPSNLDEAAEEYSLPKEEPIIPYTKADIKQAFKAGAKRMAEKAKQEQPEVDLEREAVMFCFDNGINITPRQAKEIANHFYELGLKAKEGIK